MSQGENRDRSVEARPTMGSCSGVLPVVGSLVATLSYFASVHHFPPWLLWAAVRQ